MELPKITNIQSITPEQAAEYVRFVATLRHNQNRWFRFKDPSALNLSRQMEKELDELNGRLLNPVPSLFDKHRGDMDKCNECVLKHCCFKYSEDGECTNPAFNGTQRFKKKRSKTNKNKIVWRKCQAGYKFPSDAIVIPDDDRTTDRDPRLVRCAVWDSKYILIDELKKLPVDNG